jgi:hypothetical protein
MQENLVLWVMKKLLHFLSGSFVLQYNRMLILASMIGMEKFLAEGFKCGNFYMATD